MQINIDQEIAPKNTWNLDLAASALTQLKALRAGGATVISAHDEMQWQTLRNGLEFYE